MSWGRALALLNSAGQDREAKWAGARWPVKSPDSAGGEEKAAVAWRTFSNLEPASVEIPASCFLPSHSSTSRSQAAQLLEQKLPHSYLLPDCSLTLLFAPLYYHNHSKMPASIPAGVYGRRIPAGGIPILAAVDPSAAVSAPSHLPSVAGSSAKVGFILAFQAGEKKFSAV